MSPVHLYTLKAVPVTALKSTACLGRHINASGRWQDAQLVLNNEQCHGRSHLGGVNFDEYFPQLVQQCHYGRTDFYILHSLPDAGGGVLHFAVKM